MFSVLWNSTIMKMKVTTEKQWNGSFFKRAHSGSSQWTWPLSSTQPPVGVRPIPWLFSSLKTTTVLLNCRITDTAAGWVHTVLYAVSLLGHWETLSLDVFVSSCFCCCGLTDCRWVCELCWGKNEALPGDLSGDLPSSDRTGYVWCFLLWEFLTSEFLKNSFLALKMKSVKWFFQKSLD